MSLSGKLSGICREKGVGNRDVSQHSRRECLGNGVPTLGIPDSGAFPTASGISQRESRAAAHKAKLAADPRFAALVAGLKLEPFADPYPDPEALAADAERAELHRQACQAALQRAEMGKDVPEDFLAWARAVCARFQPLRRPLSTGDHPA